MLYCTVLYYTVLSYILLQLSNLKHQQFLSEAPAITKHLEY